MELTPENKKVLNPDEICIEILHRLQYSLYPGMLDENKFKKVLSEMIREYGEQQYQKGKLDHSKEISDQNS